MDAKTTVRATDVTAARIARLATFRRGLRRFLASSEAITGASGVTSQQYQALLEISAAGAELISVGDLAQGLLIQPHGAVQLADRLQDAGLVERRRSAADARQVLLALTAKGEALLALLADDHLQALRRCEPLLAGVLSDLRKIGR
jgi:DNA-binding MarR family transcriptional regulator